MDIVSLTVFFSLYDFFKGQIADTIGKEENITAEIKREESLSLMQQDIGDGQAYESKLNDYFVQSNDVAGFLKILEDIIFRSNLKSEINAVTYGSTPDLSAIGAESVDVK